MLVQMYLLSKTKPADQCCNCSFHPGAEVLWERELPYSANSKFYIVLAFITSWKLSLSAFPLISLKTNKQKKVSKSLPSSPKSLITLLAHFDMLESPLAR